MALFEEDFDFEAALEEAIEEDQNARGSADADPGEPAGEAGEAEGEQVGEEEGAFVSDAAHFGIDVADESKLPEAEELPVEGRAFHTAATRLGLTYARCTMDPKALLQKLVEQPWCLGGRAVRETHADGTPHVHVFLQKKRTKVSGTAFDVNGFHPNIRPMKTQAHAVHWHFYLEKEGRPVQCGVYKVPTMGGRGKKGVDILKDAQKDGVKVALEKYIEAGGQVEKVPMVQKGLEIMLAPEQKKARWQHVADAQQITLRAWQKDLIAKLKEPPQPRQLFWVSGPPGCGKTTFSNEIKKIFGNDDVLFCGKSVSYDGLVYMYTQQSVVVFDFPKSYDWAQMAKPAAACIEKFTEFGSMMNTPKYRGKGVQLLGHCVVFANVECIQELMHRDVVEINLSHMSEAQRNRL